MSHYHVLLAAFGLSGAARSLGRCAGGAGYASVPIVDDRRSPVQQGDATSRPSSGDSRLVVVAGSGRSGTSTLAGLLSHLGVTVPEPQIPANKTNPKGFYESAWAVEFHKRILAKAAVPQYDARPSAFDQTAAVGSEPAVRDQLRQWLSTQFDTASEVLIKDPRDTWFLPLWCSIAQELGARPGVAMTIRHPAEVVGSHAHHYQKKRLPRPLDGTNRTANWINLTLETEHATRNTPRAFVRYTDVLSDWRSSAQRIGEALDLSFQHGISPEAAAEVDSFIDPSLHRIQVTWDDVDAPVTIIELAEAVWQETIRLIDQGPDNAEARAALDALRADYLKLYTESEEIARSSMRAAHRAGLEEAAARRRRKAAQDQGAADRKEPAKGRRAATKRSVPSDETVGGAPGGRPWRWVGEVKRVTRHGMRKVQAMAKREG